MTRLTPLRSLAVAAAAVAVAPWAHADGLADLRASLARLQAQTPLKATLDVKTTERSGEGAEALEKAGAASVQLADGARGLEVLYGRDTLSRLDAESRLLVRDPNARTPTTWALGKLDSADLMPMASAVGEIARAIDENTFKGEKADTWNGKPARLLTFSVPLTKVPERQRKYIKEFDATVSIWIGPDGTPLASGVHSVVKGRAFVVVSFEATEDRSTTYGVVGDRLLTLHSETHTISSGAGERGEQRVVKTLAPLS